MYYFLNLIGVIFIVLGINDEKIDLVSNISNDPEELSDLIKRIDHLEKMVYDVEIDFDEDEIQKFENYEKNYKVVEQQIIKTDEPLTILDTLRQCEEEGYSLEKTCSILKMNKGEVLLLKNLYKSYQG